MSLDHGVNSVNAMDVVIYTPLVVVWLVQPFASELETVISLTRPIALAKWKILRSVKNLVVRRPFFNDDRKMLTNFGTMIGDSPVYKLKTWNYFNEKTMNIDVYALKSIGDD